MSTETRDAFDSAYVDGQPPSKQQAREIGTVIDGQMEEVRASLASIGEGVVAGDARIVSTKAILDAGLGYPAGTIGVVYADSTAANNGYYLKAGASGAGSWSKIAAMTLPVEIIDRVTALETDLASLGALALLSVVGIGDISTDARAALRDRTTHTGVQPISSVDGLSVALAAEATAREAVDAVVADRVAAAETAISTLNVRAASIERSVTANTVLINKTMDDVNARFDVLKTKFADFWISSLRGSPSNSGTSQNAPWADTAQLIAYANANPGALSGKTIVYECGGIYTPFDLYALDVDDCTIASYGLAGGKPIFDCTAAIPSAWTLYATGIWTVTRRRTPGVSSAKLFGNYFRTQTWTLPDGSSYTGLFPLRKVESIAALSGKGDYVVYAANENTDAITLYMTAPSDPGSDGASYRWSKYGSAISLSGRRNTIAGLYGFGNAAQDGVFNLYGDGADKSTLGGNRLLNCDAWWGGRHSAYLGSGSIPSFAIGNRFYGGANDIETGGILSASGTANSIVANSPDHSTATVVFRDNEYYGMRRPNYLTGAVSNFTGPYGHDGVAGRAMLRMESSREYFSGMAQGQGAAGQTSLFEYSFYDSMNAAFAITHPNVSIYLNDVLAGSNTDMLFSNLNSAGITLIARRCNIYTKNCGGGFAGWLRAGEGSTAVTNVDIENCKFHIQGINSANINRYFVRIRAGTFRWRNNIVIPQIATPVDYLFDLGVGSGVVTIDAASDLNTYPIGAKWRHAGVVYGNLAAWKAHVTAETYSAYHVLTASISDAFGGPDANLDDVWPWTRLNGAAGDLQRKGGGLYSAVTSLTPTVYKRGALATNEQWVRYRVKNTAGSGGPALHVADGSNAMWIRASSTQIQIMAVIAGTVSQVLSSSGVTPSVGSEVYVVSRWVTNPVTGAQDLRYWIIVDGVTGASMATLTGGATAIDSALSVGAAGRSTAGDQLDDLAFGIAPLAYAA